jgi:hypothetical protein
MRGSMFEAYENGLLTLQTKMGEHHPDYSEFLIYEQRLRENIAQSRKYGDTSNLQNDRAQIIQSLNELSRIAVGTTFNDLCRSNSISSSVQAEPTQQSVSPETNTNHTFIGQVPDTDKTQQSSPVFSQRETDPMSKVKDKNSIIMLSLLILLIIVIVFVIYRCEVFGICPTFSYKVVVQEQDNPANKIEAAEVKVQLPGEEVLPSLITDPNGLAIFTIPDKYEGKNAKITITKEGYIDITDLYRTLSREGTENFSLEVR